MDMDRRRLLDCMYVCNLVCMYVWSLIMDMDRRRLLDCMYACSMELSMYVWNLVCMYVLDVCIELSMYVCMYGA